jgi:hypothetical protein
MLAYVSCRKKALASGRGKGFEIDPADGEKREKMRKRYYFEGTNLPIY